MVETFSRPSFWLGVTMWIAAVMLWRHQSAAPTHALAQAVPVPAAASNAYWAGYVATRDAPYSAVRATWSVPAIPCPTGNDLNATAYVWIGEGGFLRGLLSPLIQAGTASDCFDGSPRYHAFFEWYPGIYATDFPLLVQPNDEVTATIRESQPNFWTLTLRDETSGKQSTTATYYNADTGSAEFVVERPTMCTGLSCGQVALAPFGQLSFSNPQVLSAANSSPIVPSASPVALGSDLPGRVLAQPARLPAPAGGFSVLWRHSQ